MGTADRHELLRALVRAQEEERRRIAGDLHDDAVQVMFGAAFMLQALNREPMEPEQAAVIDEVATALTSAGERLRRLMLDLQPPPAGDQTLALVLTRAARRAAAAGGFEVSVRDGLSSAPSVDQFTVAYRIAQEALTNIVRHARADHVTVVLEERDGGLAVRVEDDGVGCPPDALTAMRDRATLAGGWLRVDGGPPRPGTVVDYWLPLSVGSER
jgi:signal transduction histidine kinase